MKKPNLHIVRVLLLIAILAFSSTSVPAEELIILSMNTEFFFDHEAPHGEVVGSSNGPPIPTEQEWKTKAKAIAKKIDSTYANIVGLAEVENQRVVEEVKANLHNPASWHVVFEEGRDTFTGQDVALLTKYPAIQESITNFPDEREVYFQNDKEESVNPSKILAATIILEDMDFYLIVTHLISRRGNNDAKRLAQANVLRRHAVMAMMKNQNVIVMGDMNDTPETPAIKRIRGLDDIWQDLIQTANEVPAEERYTYVHEGEKNLLDHILLSPSLYKYFRQVSQEKRCKIIGLDGISGHRAVLARVRVE